MDAVYVKILMVCFCRVSRAKDETEKEDTRGLQIPSATISPPFYTSLGVACACNGSCLTAYSLLQCRIGKVGKKWIKIAIRSLRYLMRIKWGVFYTREIKAKTVNVLYKKRYETSKHFFFWSSLEIKFDFRTFLALFLGRSSNYFLLLFNDP